MNDINVGVLLPIGKSQWGPGADPRELIDVAVDAERRGFNSLWVNDSLISPRIEALTMLAAVAASTGRVTLGTAALMPVLRRPIQAAQALASIDLLSGGRLTVAVGAGFPGRLGRPLHDLSEVPWQNRFARLDETVSLWRHLWMTPEPTSFRGSFFDFAEIPETTAPSQKGGPPIWLGGFTPAAFERIGRMYDGWLPYPPDPAQYAEGLAAVNLAAAGPAGGRVITPALFVSVAIADGVEVGREMLRAYSETVYRYPLEQLEQIQALVAGPSTHVLEGLGRYVRAGARHLVLRIAALDLEAQRAQLARLAELIPAIRAL